MHEFEDIATQHDLCRVPGKVEWELIAGLLPHQGKQLNLGLIGPSSKSGTWMTAEPYQPRSGAAGDGG